MSQTVSPNLKDLLTIKCSNDKSASITLAGYQGYLYLTLFAERTKIFQQVINRPLAHTLVKGLTQALTIAPGEKVGVLVFKSWNPSDTGKGGEWIPTCYMKIGKNDSNQVVFSIKSKKADSEYQFILTLSNNISADWCESEADRSKLFTEAFIELLKNFSVYDASARLDRPVRTGGTTSNTKVTSDNSPF
jgi:hypothetical protein